MRRESRTTSRIGSIGEFAAWTRRVVRDPRAADRVPKNWFDSDATADRANREHVSAEGMVKLLSPGNLGLLDAINRHHPASLRELSALTGRKEASPSRTLKRFGEAGIVAFEKGPRGARTPFVIATRVHLEIDLAGRPGAVAIEALC
jgi:predicted transcriptional regulator